MIKTALSMAMAVLTLAQTDQLNKPAFEVASIHQAKDDGHHGSDAEQGSFTTHNLTLKRLIAIAYDIDARQIYGGPNWLDSDSYNISAKIPAEFTQHRTREKVPEMIQSLLAERFQLVIHREPRQISGYKLVVAQSAVARNGAPLTPATPDERGSSINSKNSHLTAKQASMEAFAKHLSHDRDIGMLVVNDTGLAGGFDFELDWLPEALRSKADASPDDRPSIFTALQEQLGLKLESAKVTMLAVVVDHAEKPDAN